MKAKERFVNFSQLSDNKFLLRDTYARRWPSFCEGRGGEENDQLPMDERHIPMEHHCTSRQLWTLLRVSPEGIPCVPWSILRWGVEFKRWDQTRTISTIKGDSQKIETEKSEALRQKGGGGSARTRKTKLFPQKVFLATILGPPKHVLHLVWSSLGIY